MSDTYSDKGEKTIKKTKHFFPDSGIVHFGERLKEAMNGESTLSFAKRCGLSEGTVRKYINGLSYPAIDKIPSISKACGKDIEWLVTGKNGDSSNSNESERLVMSDTEIHEWWAVICKSLQLKELKHVISVFKRHGVSAIFKDEILQQEQSEEKQLKNREILTSNQSESPGYHLSQSSINTAEILHKLTAEQRREILRKYEIDEGDSKNTINQTVTQHKKEAS